MTLFILYKMENEIKDYRYERKFITYQLTPKDIEFIIKHNHFAFSEIFYERRVNNIYLDSLDLKSRRENVDGNVERVKVRIRWYGKVFGLIKKPVLELKIKKNELGKKMTFALKPFRLDKKFSLKLLQKVFRESNLPDWVREQVKLISPTLLNSYKRKYFSSFDKKCRITIDKDLIYFRIKDTNNLFIERLDEKEKCVIELKYDIKDHDEIKNITKEFPLRLIANSKYVLGVNLLNDLF